MSILKSDFPGGDAGRNYKACGLIRKNNRMFDFRRQILKTVKRGYGLKYIVYSSGIIFGSALPKNRKVAQN
jgi:hypothetical protein